MSGQTTENDATPRERECGWCGLVARIAYVDMLDIEWCDTCYTDTFLESFTPIHERIIPPEWAAVPTPPMPT